MVKKKKGLYPHDVVKAEARVVGAKLFQKLFQQFEPAERQTCWHAALYGLYQLSGDELQSTNFFIPSHLLQRESAIHIHDYVLKP